MSLYIMLTDVACKDQWPVVASLLNSSAASTTWSPMLDSILNPTPDHRVLVLALGPWWARCPVGLLPLSKFEEDYKVEQVGKLSYTAQLHPTFRKWEDHCRDVKP